MIWLGTNSSFKPYLMYILGVDTSSAKASAALTEGAVVLRRSRRNHSATCSHDLLRMIDRLLQDGALRLAQIDLFAVAVGPGSFTGLRIGLGSAMGLADSLGKPVAGVGTLDAMARVHDELDLSYLCPITRARRGNVYAALYMTKNGGIRKITDDLEISPDCLAEMIDGSVRFVGDGFAPYAGLFKDKIPHHIEVIETPDRSCAEGVALLAYERATGGDLESGAPTPKYVSRPQAEVNFAKLQTSTFFAGDDKNER